MEKKKKPKYRVRLFFLSVCSLVASCAPLLGAFTANAHRYVQAPSDAFKLSLGGVLALIFLVLKVLGKLKIPRRIVAFAIVFVLAYLLKPVLADLPLLSGMALVGEAADALLFRGAIKRTREQMQTEKIADSTAEKVEEALKKMTGGT